MNRFVANYLFGDPDAAARKADELAKTVEAVQGRQHSIENIDGPSI
ncbi:hypothetical protein [Bradyrhizobium sp. STM 3562]